MGSSSRTSSEFHKLFFYVNGEKVEVEDPRQEWTLLDFLRTKLYLTGTKESCGEGGCGACTVMLSKFDSENEEITNKSINSCLTPLSSVHGCAVLTVEGLGNIRKGLHPVQERIAKSHGTQCGFCTPGFVMSMYTLLKNTQRPTAKEVEHNLAGNLCRCTGYRPILQGFSTFCKTQEDIEDIELCNGVGPLPAGTSNVLCNESEFEPYDPNKNPVFPEDLKRNWTTQSFAFQNTRQNKWFVPNSLKKALDLKSEFLQSSVFVAGNTALGLKAKFIQGDEKPVVIQITNIPELNVVEKLAKKIIIGACVTFAKLEKFCKENSNDKSGNVITILKDMTTSLAGPQIRNMATIGGNILSANPSSHFITIVMAMEASATIIRQAGTRIVKLDEDFFKNTLALGQDEILKNITIPINQDANEFVWWKKQSRRKVNDLGIVNCCIRVNYTDEFTITAAALVYGGCGTHVKLATNTSKYLISKKIGPIKMDEVNELLDLDFSVSLKGQQLENYRKMLIKTFFLKFWTALRSHVSGESKTNSPDSPALKASQLFEIRPSDQPMEDLIGRPFAHVSALKHATGEAIYTNDIPKGDSDLVGSLVLSTRAHAKLISIDASTALSLKGVIAFFDSRDLLPEQNIFQDEQVFAIDKVTCVGQVIGFILAVDQQTADRAARLVNVKYEDILPLILTIEDAIQNNSYLHTHNSEAGDVEIAFKNAKHILEGEMRVGGQEHFYMETQSCVVVPKEENEIEVYIASQGSCDVQRRMASCLGIPANRIIYRIKRIGGGFGGKGTRALCSAIPTALAAYRKPVRCIMNRRDDMSSTGGRNPALVKFKVGFDSHGKIDGIQEWIYLNGGNTLDCSGSVLEHMIVMHDSAYNIPNWKIEGFACKTNLPSNTAFRGFGVPQMHITTETIMEKVAERIQNCSPQKIREMHFYNETDKNPFGFLIENCTIRRCWEECVKSSNFVERKFRIEKWNQNEKNKWKKRGISIIPTRHNIGMPVKYLQQGGALVMIYLDGSVALSHGGVEMGQGIHTKMIQIASRVLGIPTHRIYLTETSSDKIPNSHKTMASISSDVYGMAVKDACEKLKERLEPYKKSNPERKWEDWVMSVHMDRVNLSASGFDASMDCGVDAEINEKDAKLFHYSTYGVACSEVEIDCLTGDHTVLQTDIVMDVGESLNPAIDIGQIEGGFVQGYGLFTLEEHIYSPQGQLLTNGPMTYKIPSVSDIPRVFNVSLLRGAPNPKAIYSSKAVSEPPLFLAASIFFAIKEGIKSRRIEDGLSPTFQLDSPATAAQILLACGNSFSE